jgi:hypothetical protein
MNAPLIPQPYFPTLTDTDSALACYCVEAANAMQAVTDMLGNMGVGVCDSLDMDDLAALLRIIQSPLDHASKELHRRSSYRDEKSREKEFSQVFKHSAQGAV